MPAPQRRRHGRPDADALAGLDETTPPTAEAADEPAPRRLSKAADDDLVLGTPTQGRGAPAPRARTAAGGAGAKARVGFYQLTDDTARARAAYKWTGNREGHRSFSDFLAAAIMNEVERLERDYNNGQPWAGVEAGEIPTGKPLS